MPAPQPGVRIGVPETRTLLSSEHQGRQFEYHPSLCVMSIGTLAGEVILTDWKNNHQLGACSLPEEFRAKGGESVFTTDPVLNLACDLACSFADVR
jgi:hypothetical protein